MNRYDKQHIIPIIGTLFLAVSPHFFSMPAWIMIWCILMWGYMILAFRKRVPLPKNIHRLIFTVFGFIGLLVTSGLVFGADTYIRLLTIMSALKPMEISSYRDKIVTLFLAYFIVITNLFVSDSLSILFYMFASVFFSTAVLIHIHHPGGKFQINLRRSASIMLQAVPFMILLFIMFPRFHSSIFHLTGQKTGYTGFTDRLSLGNISRLVYSNKTAFRVEFEKDIPNRNLLYFRGVVFSHFNGTHWDVGKHVPARMKPIKGEHEVNYTIMMEPHRKKYLFALDLPAIRPHGTRLLRDNTLISWRSVKRTFHYKLKSYTTWHTDELKRPETLQLPAHGNLKTKALAKTWLDSAKTPERIVSKALDYFAENGFVYTLKPSVLRGNKIDDFLFRTRNGYCEHYASAFAFIMRAAGIPARIVGGYLGGELNPYGNYLIVRQFDAHVWVEIWLENKGWVRIDPTSVVAPKRISGGLVDALSVNDLPFFLRSKTGIISKYREMLRLRWDFLNTRWEMWFIGYSHLDQQTLLSKLGIKTDSWKNVIKILLLFSGIITIIFSLICIRRLKTLNPKKDPVQEIYALFCQKLAFTGISRSPEIGPKDYADQIIRLRRDLKKDVEDITSLYILLRYQQRGDERSLKKFKGIVKRFAVTS